jgi:coniferyl-aldehyde dehydrogenase
MIFTGSTSVGKTVMAAAAENLVPVILELGGKSPAIIHPSMDMKDVAQRLLLVNCGMQVKPVLHLTIFLT